MLKVCLVGVGGISGAHIPVWKSMNDVELVAICDVRLERMEKYVDINHYTDYEEMLEVEKPDIVDICLQTYLHAEYSIKAMEKGMHVICEKPVSLHHEDVKKIYDTAEKYDVKFMVAQVLRFWPEYEVLHNLYKNKTYGKLLSGSMSRLGSYPAWSWDGWMMEESRSGMVPFDLHIHDLDYIVYTFGAPKNKTSFRSKCKDQDYVNVVYEFDGFFVNAEASWYASPYPFSSKFRFQFEEAVVAYEGGILMIYQKDKKVIDWSTGESGEMGAINLPQTDAYANEIRYFVDCVKNNCLPEKIKMDELQTVIQLLQSL